MPEIKKAKKEEIRGAFNNINAIVSMWAVEKNMPGFLLEARNAMNAGLSALKIELLETESVKACIACNQRVTEGMINCRVGCPIKGGFIDG